MSTTDKKAALVTGASRGIGRAIALGLAKAGHHVLVNYRQREADARETIQLIEAQGGTAEVCGFDVSDPAACEQAVSRILQSHKRVDFLIHNAGVRSDALLVFMKPEQWSEVIATNLNSFYHLTRPIVKEMALNRWGRVVAIASTSGQTGVEGQANYAAAKAGLIGAAKSLAREVARRGVTVNVVAPGFIETEMIEEEAKKRYLAQIPAGRFGRADEVAAAVVYLCSESAGYVTGSVLNVNGGVYT